MTTAADSRSENNPGASASTGAVKRMPPNDLLGGPRNAPQSWLSLAIVLWLDSIYTLLYSAITGIVLIYKRLDRGYDNEATLFLDLALALVLYPSIQYLRLHLGAVPMRPPIVSPSTFALSVIVRLSAFKRQWLGFFVRDHLLEGAEWFDVDVVIGSIALALAAAELLLGIISGFIFSVVHYDEYGKRGPVAIVLSAALMLGTMIAIVAFDSD
ncbi:hypothetical protein FOZ61_006383 [Perkinsus olseni]|uniref:Uncharacterized protein n=1 Tax=Perkinsus olseni TaxID=32597 RepID=A0A7J6LDL0_PEROL|nr:hypothetical protein FOZ61_006383 [Perkinsus olseni]